MEGQSLFARVDNGNELNRHRNSSCGMNFRSLSERLRQNYSKAIFGVPLPYYRTARAPAADSANDTVMMCFTVCLTLRGGDALVCRRFVADLERVAAGLCSIKPS